MPPSAAAIAPIAPATRWTNTDSASPTRASQSAGAGPPAGVSPESPSRPDSWPSAHPTSSREGFACACRCRTTSGSTEPERVAIGTPSSGTEPHRRVDGPAVADRAHRAAAAEVADDELLHAHLFRCPLHRQSVEAVPPHLPFLAPAFRDRVCRRLVGKRGVKRRVEYGDVRDVGNSTACFLERDQCRPVVQRRELLERIELALDFLVDDDRIAKPQPAVDDAVRDRLDRLPGSTRTTRPARQCRRPRPTRA